MTRFCPVISAGSDPRPGRSRISLRRDGGSRPVAGRCGRDRAAPSLSCSGGGEGSVPTTSALPSEDTSPTVRRNVDGALHIGVWLPTSGPAAALGSPLAAGVELAVREINEAGGVNGTHGAGGEPGRRGRPGDRVPGRCESCWSRSRSTPSSGRRRPEWRWARSTPWPRPTSSTARRPRRPSTSAGYRDNGFFVRTIGSEALEAVALTKAMIATGRTAFVVLYPDDDYGLAFANEVQRSFRRLREGVKLVPYDPTAEHFNAPAEQALADPVGAIGVVGTGQTGADVLAALEQNGRRPAAHLRVRDRRPPPGRPGDDDRPAPAREPPPASRACHRWRPRSSRPSRPRSPCRRRAHRSGTPATPTTAST